MITSWRLTPANTSEQSKSARKFQIKNFQWLISWIIELMQGHLFIFNLHLVYLKENPKQVVYPGFLCLLLKLTRLCFRLGLLKFPRSEISVFVIRVVSVLSCMWLNLWENGAYDNDSKDWGWPPIGSVNAGRWAGKSCLTSSPRCQHNKLST